MKLLILQLSDMHLASALSPVLTNTHKIVDAARSFETDIGGIVVLFTGDIVYSGRAEEYAVAKRFWKDLSAALTTVASTIHTLAIPGNHDCYLEEADPVRDILIEKIVNKSHETTAVDKSVVTTCVCAQKHFFSFYSDLKGNAANQTIAYSDILEFGGDQIIFHCYNTAWMSQIKEIQGGLIFPSNFIGVADTEPGDALHISLLHHPYNWLEAANARQFKRHIESTSHLIFTGHEHESEFYTKKRQEGKNAHYFEGGVLFNKDTPDASTFNLLAVDLQSKTYRASLFEWNDGMFHPSEDSAWSQIEINSDIGAEQLRMDEAFHDSLLDVGANFTHPRKAKLTLNDIYVFPDFRDGSAPTQERPFRVIKEDAILKLISEKRSIFISGREKIGKTALLKALYLCTAKDNASLLISGAELKEIGGDTIRTALRNTFSKQYAPALWTQFEQLHPDHKILFIDDFHKITVNAKGKNEILRVLLQLFSSVVITSSDEVSYDELIDIPPEESVWQDITSLEIMECGYVSREKIVRKWCSLGNQYKVDPGELDDAVHDAHSKITTLLGKNLIPSFPLFTLILLQQLEAGKNNSTANGSYGYMYEYIITEALSGSQFKEAELDTKYSYLSLIAYTMFCKSETRLSESEVIIAHEQYLKENDLRFDFSRIRDDLLEASILERKGDLYAFKYPYQYYYFAARYFMLHTGDHVVSAALTEMCEQLYNEQAANIIIFYTYLTQDKAVIRRVLDHSRTLYSSHQPFDFGPHPESLKIAQEKVDELKFDFAKFNIKREQILDARGQTIADEEAKEQDDNKDQGKDEATTLNEMLLVNDAFKTLQILGQILRNFPGSLGAGLKREITNECYLLGLRMLNALLSHFTSDKAALIDHVGQIVMAEFAAVDERGRNKQKVVAKHELRERAKEFIAQEFHKITYSVIRRIIDAVGAKNLMVTYEAIKKGNRSVSFEMIDAAIRMDYAKPFPTDDVVSLAHSLHRDNMFSFGVFRHLVWVNLYVFHKKDAVRQALCEALSISVANKRLVNNTQRR